MLRPIILGVFPIGSTISLWIAVEKCMRRSRSRSKSQISIGTCMAVILGPIVTASAAEQKIGAPPEAMNMRLVGYDDLQGRSAYQPTIHHQGNRYIAYIGHHGGTPEVPKPTNALTGQPEINGTSIVDVTDPAHPQYLAHIPGMPGNYEEGGAQMTRVCDGRTLPKGDPNKTYLLRVFGGKSHQIFDVTDPAKPALIWRREGELNDTHKSFWECDSGIAYLVSGVPGWRVNRMTEVYDLSDPAHPVKIRDFGLPGQQPSASGPIPEQLHGMISLGPQGNRIYFGYGTNKNGIMQIVDRDKLIHGPKKPTAENLLFPEVGKLVMTPFNGAHTTFPMPKMPIAEFAKDAVGAERDIVMIVDEQIRNACEEPRQMAWFVDVTIEAHPMVISNFQVPEASGNFCSRGGRFGTHASNESMAAVFYKKIVFLSYFNAGVRAVDVRDPYHPKEIGYFIPAITAATDKRCAKPNGQDSCKMAVQTNNVETDDRGYIYIVDRANTGMHILELTGEARAVALQ
jgi:hypothetical protein